jgi:hypothetical protein
LRFEDDAVVAGTRYDYRLGVQTGAEEAFAGEVAVEVPRAELELAGAMPNPARSSALNVRFRLAGFEPARLELIDVSGRRVIGRELGALGSGWHTTDLATGARIRPGVYALRLTQGTAQIGRRVVVVD